MKTIKTNLAKDTHFVLTDDNDKIIGIIHVPQDEQNITLKVLQAIKDDCLPVYAVLVSDLYIDPTTTSNSITFEVEIQEERGDEVFVPSFYLTMTEVY